MLQKVLLQTRASNEQIVHSWTSAVEASATNEPPATSMAPVEVLSRMTEWLQEKIREMNSSVVTNEIQGNRPIRLRLSPRQYQTCQVQTKFWWNADSVIVISVMLFRINEDSSTWGL